MSVPGACCAAASCGWGPDDWWPEGATDGGAGVPGGRTPLDEPGAAMLSDAEARIEAQAALIGRLAAALGACAACFGRDVLCPACEGGGGPGTRHPDPEAFAAVVAPALAHLACGAARPGCAALAGAGRTDRAARPQAGLADAGAS